MSPKHITYIAVISLVLIFVTQLFLVSDYYQTTRASLTRESDAILEKSFRMDLNLRKSVYNHITGGDTVLTPPPPTKENTINYDCSKMSDYKDNILGLLDLAINNSISKLVPLNIHQLDSVTGVFLRARNINSNYLIKVINPSTGRIQQQSKNIFQTSFFTIPSKYLKVDFDENKSLQLLLVNPFGLILKRMGLMLLSSLVLSCICLLAFVYLLRILAKQKQLVTFKNEFLGTIAHELKRPVASLSFNLDCLTVPAFIDNRLQHDLLVSKSINATSELNDTINMIVALTKLEEGLLVLNKQPVNLKKLFDELKTKFMSTSYKKVEIETRYDSTELNYPGDPILLTQCFANLIDNAIKYSNNEVLIIISVHKSDKWIIVSIQDNGFGIPEQKLPLIFDKYSRAHTDNNKINGFGIGLNYVKTIVEKHKGEVNVKSQPGEGTEFSVLLPE